MPNIEMVSASYGGVVNIVHDTPRQWRRDIEAYKNTEGFGHVELWIEHIPSSSSLRQLEPAVQGMPVTVHGPFIHMPFTAKDQEIGKAVMKRATAAVQVAESIGAQAFTIHTGKYAVFEDHDEVLSRFAERYHELSSVTCVPIGVENVNAKKSGVERATVASSEDLRKLCVLLPNVHFTLDTGHSIQNGDEPSELSKEFAASLLSVHLHDAVPGGKSHQTLGAAALNIPLMAEAVVAFRPRFVTLELLSYQDTVQSLRTFERCLGQAAMTAPPPVKY